MSVQHTLGRLVVKDNGDANSYALLDDSGNWWMSVLLNGEQITARQEANLRRLAACWNACEGFETETLEGANLHESAYAAEGRQFELTQEADTLRDDLRKVEANYEAARGLLEEIDRMDDACGIATGPGEAFTTYKFQELMAKVSAFLNPKGGAL